MGAGTTAAGGEGGGGMKRSPIRPYPPSADASGAALLELLTYLVQSPEVSVLFTCIILLLHCLSVVPAIDDEDVIINTFKTKSEGGLYKCAAVLLSIFPPNYYSSILFSSFLMWVGAMRMDGMIER